MFSASSLVAALMFLILGLAGLIMTAPRAIQMLLRKKKNSHFVAL